MESDQCIICNNYQMSQTCKAYNKIPFEIFSGEHDHRKPFPGDNGIRFEEKKK